MFVYGVANVLGVHPTRCLRKRLRNVCMPRDAIIPFQLSWLDQGKRQDRVHEDVIVSKTVRVSRQGYFLLPELHE